MFYPQCEPNFKRLYIPRLSQKVCFICTLFKTLNKVSSVATFLLNFNSPLGERPYNSKICILKAIITDDCWIFLNITVSVPSIRSSLTESIVWINSDIIDMNVCADRCRSLGMILFYLGWDIVSWNKIWWFVEY